MNKFIYYMAALWLAGAALSASAENRHFLDVWGGGGYDALLHGMEHTNVPGGGGFALFLFLFFTDDKAVAGGFYGGGNLFEGDDGRVVGEQQVFGRKIHNGRLHAPKILYGCLDVVGTHGTTHFEHGKYAFYHTHGTCLS